MPTKKKPVAEPKKMGRPRKDVDPQQVARLAELMCTQDEIAHVLGVCPKTLDRRLQEPEFREALEGGQAQGKMSLRRLQWQHAQQPGSSGANMAIWLGKQWLGQGDKIDLKAQVDSKVEVTTAADRVKKKLDGLHSRLTDKVALIAAAAGASVGGGEPVESGASRAPAEEGTG